MLIHEINEENYFEENQYGFYELQKKFESYDALRVNKKLKGDDLKIKLAGLFKDPTIWAYGTLKDNQGNPLRLYPFQDKFINDKHRFIHVTAANQTGKTLGICLKALHHALLVPNASVLIISASERQSIMILDEIKWLLRRASIPYQDMIGQVENRMELQIDSPKGGISTIRSFPPTMKVLGFHGTLILLDETGFWEKEIELSPIEYYQQVIEPRTNATKNWKHPFLTIGQIVSITNPNGEQGLSYELFNDERYHQYIYNWLANPNNTLEEYLFHKKRLPPYRFASIYAATYMSPEGGFITFEQYKAFASHNHPLIISQEHLFLGGDFASEDAHGKNTDWNVLYGVQHVLIPNSSLRKLRLVYYKEWPPGTKKENIYEEIRRLNNYSPIGKFAYDKVGVSDKILNDLKDRNILSEYQIEALPYSLPNKSQVYVNFQSLFEHGLIEGTDIPKLRDQLLGLKVTQPEGSTHLKIHHKTEGLKDDHPDALANACYAARVNSNQPSISIVQKRTNLNFLQPQARLNLLICPECEKIDYNGEAGYYRGRSPTGQNLERIPCPRHYVITI